MRVLLDECVPRPFRRELVPHDVRTIQEMGWKGFKNGKLLAAMSAAGFETLVTVDQNMQFQQNIGSAGVGVILMIAPTNRLDDLTPLAPDVLVALATIKPGDHVVVGP